MTNLVTCPHCRIAVEADIPPPSSCPACGVPLVAPVPADRWNSAIVSGVLFLPLSPLLFSNKRDAAAASVMVVAPLLSLIGGMVLGRRLSRTVRSKCSLVILLPVVMLICSETLLAIGCSCTGVN